MIFNLISDKKIKAQGINKFFLLMLVFIILFELLLSPFPILAKTTDFNVVTIIEDKTTEIASNIGNKALEIVKNSYSNTNEEAITETDSETILSQSFHTITAYNSEVAQCDASPCITANGFNVCEHGIEDTIAANFLRFGTKVRIPELFGDKIFIVRDRMNSRYTERVDVWLLSHDNAIDFGVKYVKIEVLE